MKIITPNVTATKIQPNRDGICWQVGDEKYRYVCALRRATDGRLFDVLKAPVGTLIEGDITTEGFHPHNNKITRRQSQQWNKANWIKCFGNDNDYYGDIEFVTYKNPRSKTGKLRTDLFASISIREETKVTVFRKNGKRKTMSIPIELVVEKHPHIYDEDGCIIYREKLI